MKYVTTMLTEDERHNTMYYVALENSLQLSYFFLWLPVCFAFFLRYRKDPVGNAQMKNRIIGINIFQLSAWIWASYKKGQTMTQMESKYLHDLSDYEIANFEQIYQQLQAQNM